MKKIVLALCSASCNGDSIFSSHRRRRWQFLASSGHDADLRRFHRQLPYHRNRRHPSKRRIERVDCISASCDRRDVWRRGLRHFDDQLDDDFGANRQRAYCRRWRGNMPVKHHDGVRYGDRAGCRVWRHERLRRLRWRTWHAFER